MRAMATILAFFLAFAGWSALAAEPAAKPAAEKKSENGAQKKANKKDARAISTSPAYLGIDPIYTTMLERDSVVGTFMLGIGLDVPDPGLRDYVSRNMPLLRDVYVRTLLVYTSVNIRSWRQPDVEDIAARLQAVTDKKLRRKGARILLAQAAIRLNR